MSDTLQGVNSLFPEFDKPPAPMNWKRFWHEQKILTNRSIQKLKEWGYRVNEEEIPRSCGGCKFSVICEHIEGFYPEVHCNRLDILHLDGMQIEWLGVCNRYKEAEF